MQIYKKKSIALLRIEKHHEERPPKKGATERIGGEKYQRRGLYAIFRAGANCFCYSEKKSYLCKIKLQSSSI